MDFANRGNRPAQFNRPQDSQPENKSQEPKGRAKGPKQPGGKFNIGAIGSIALLTLISLLIIASLAALILIRGGNSESDLINEDGYQAVFLDSQDGQVYFGKLGIYNKDLYSLTDIYYVRVNQQIQPGTETPQQSISLAKLGGELHCPADQMFISRDQVLYWENILKDGQVVTAIDEYKTSGEKVDCGGNSAESSGQQNPVANPSSSSDQGAGAANGTAPAGSDEANQSDTPDSTGDTPPNGSDN